MKHQILALDIWGNKRDGWEINDMVSGEIIDIPDDISDKDALKMIRKALGHRADARGYTDHIGCEYGYCFDRNDTGRPAYYTRVVDDEYHESYLLRNQGYGIFL